MTFTQAKTRLLARVGDPAAGGYYSLTQAGTAINEAQRIFALLTLCLEKAGSLSLTANTTFYLPLTTFADWIVPLRVQLSTGAKVKPATLAQLAALNPRWREERGTAIARYVSCGSNLLGVFPCPSGSGTALTVTYAYSPAALSANGDVPEIPEEDHEALVDGALYLIRATEGGQEFVRSQQTELKNYLACIAARANYVRSRSRSAGYDLMPRELTAADISRLVQARKHRFLRSTSSGGGSEKESKDSEK